MAREARRTAGSGELDASVTNPQPAQRLDGTLATLGRPYRPEPTVPDTDRVPLDDRDAVAAAVALDVLSTWTRPVAGRPTVLAELTAVLARLLDVGGEQGPAARQGLLAHAGSPSGDDRAALSRRLAACLQAEDPQHELTPSSPEGVAEALRRLARMAELVVREAQLLLETRAGTEFRQA